MFLNNARFSSDGIAMRSSLLTHLNPSSVKNPPFAILDLTCLKMGLVEFSIEYMFKVLWITQCMHGITMERIIPLFYIASLNHDCYSGVNICYLAGDTELVNCNLLEISGLLFRKETQKLTLGILSVPPSTTVSNRVSNTPTQPSPERTPCPTSYPTPSTNIRRGLPTTKGGPLEVHRCNDTRRQVLSGLSI